MKKILLLMLCLCPTCADSQEGVPFFVNYPSSVYQAHNRNFDVVCDSCGNVILPISRVFFIMITIVGKQSIRPDFPVSPVCSAIRGIGYGQEDTMYSEG